MCRVILISILWYQWILYGTDIFLSIYNLTIYQGEFPFAMFLNKICIRHNGKMSINSFIWFFMSTINFISFEIRFAVPQIFIHVLKMPLIMINYAKNSNPFRNIWHLFQPDKRFIMLLVSHVKMQMCVPWFQSKMNKYYVKVQYHIC